MSAPVRSLTVMVRIDDTARADIALTPDRTYYRLATDSSIEDGQLAPVADLESVAASVVALYATPGTPLPAELKLQVFVNNNILTGAPTEQALTAIIDALVPLAPESAFLAGFKG